MVLYDNAGRIHRGVADSSLLALFVLAVLSAFSRFTVRLHYQRRLFWDDAFLVTAILLLCTCIGLWFSFVNDMYLSQSLLLGNITPDIDVTTIVPRVLRLHRLNTVAIVLTWTSLHMVKLSFLLFFGTLITPANRLRWYWWAVVGFTILTWAIGVPLEIVACPYFDERSFACAQGSKYPRTAATSATWFSLNIASDVLLISIPIIILHRIRIPLRTKIFLGMSLCLSVITIAITIIRIIGLQMPGLKDANLQAVDVVWQVYWQYVEACVGIMVVSATAFRTFFVQRAARNSAKRSPPGYHFAQRLRQKSRNRFENTNNGFDHGLPGQIPGGTMTGLRTFINDNGNTLSANTTTCSEFGENGDINPLNTPEAVYNRV